MPSRMNVELAFDYVSGAPYGENTVVYFRSRDEFLYASEMTGESDIPEDLDWDDCVEVPHANDLDLGQNLVITFVADKLPDVENCVRDMFRRRGAYSRFKEFLEQKGLLDVWHDFEAGAQRRAINEWCAENGITIKPDVGTGPE